MLRVQGCTGRLHGSNLLTKSMGSDSIALVSLLSQAIAPLSTLKVIYKINRV